ncbi:MAG TPA: YidC/Oxa1 family membrane protein insertase [Gaiellaceae bacterium]|nr:YidC/Oxa1 family membrane protein insertase [Gaiellaceae bacterium]
MILAGVLSPIEDVLTVLLEWLHATGGLSWAWSIIALTLVVRVLIVPLTVKQIRSMQHLQTHAPQLKALQQKYKNDKQRMNEEVMKFYRENKINPAASCLPILFQIPIFIALFFVLRDFETEVFPEYVAQGETHADLGWLGIVPDITASITAHWSGWLLIVVYVASQVASTFAMSTTMDKRQRWIFLALPFVFVYFIVAPPVGVSFFPMGLMLYWVTTNLWTVGQGIVTRRLVPKPEPPPKRTSRTPPREAPAAGDGATAKAVQPSRAGQPGQQRVRRRKKKGPRSRR